MNKNNDELVSGQTYFVQENIDKLVHAIVRNRLQKSQVQKVLEEWIDERKVKQENAIRTTAYFLWQAAGCPSNRDMEFWIQAEQQTTGN